MTSKNRVIAHFYSKAYKQRINTMELSQPFKHLLQYWIDSRDFLLNSQVYSKEEWYHRSLVEQIAHSIDGPEAVVLSVDDVLDRAREHFHSILHGAGTLEDLTRDLNIVEDDTPTILVPPQDATIPEGDGNGEWKVERFEPRIQRLIELLQQVEIYTDDLIIRHGISNPSAMRKASYVLVEIPRLGREILVCDQVGEATRISYTHLGREAYERLNKTELDQTSGVERIVCNNQRQWEHDIITNINRGNRGPSTKIDVRLHERILREISTHLSAEDWLNMDQLEIDDMQLPSGRFGDLIRELYRDDIEWNSSSKARMGIAFFGYGNPHISRAVAEMFNSPRHRHVPFNANDNRWKEDLIQAFPTSDAWLRLQNDSATNKEMAKQWLYSLGFPTDVIDEPEKFVGLGKNLYGADDSQLKVADQQTGYINRPYGFYCSVLKLQGALHNIEEYHRRGLHSLTLIRRLKRNAEYLQQELASTLEFAAQVKEQARSKAPFAPLDERTTRFYSYLSPLDTQAGNLRSYIEKCIEEPARLEFELPRLQQIAEAFQSALERLRTVEIIEQQTVETITPRATPLTPLIPVDRLRLTENEAIMLQMLLNEGGGSMDGRNFIELNGCTVTELKRVLDPIPESYLRGTLRAISMSLAKKLERERIGTVVGPDDRLRFYFALDTHARGPTYIS